MMYDMFGRAQTSCEFRSPVEPVPYLTDRRADGTTYLCFYDTPLRAIQRITVSGTVSKLEIAYGAWANRETLTYQPINKLLEA